MKLIKNIVTGKFAQMRHRHNKRLFTLGLFVGGAITAAASKLYGQYKCKKCIKRILAEKK